jgi:hypothetical protein
MPMVPTFQREDLPQIQQTGPQEDIASAGITGHALANLGDVGLDYAVRTIQAANYDWTANNTADFAESQTNAMLAARKKATQTGDYKGVATDFIAQLNADRLARISNAPTPRAGDAFGLHAKGVSDELTRGMSEYADAGEWKTWQSNTQTNLDKLASTSYQNPALADQNYGIGIGIINGAKAAGIGGDKVDWAQQSDSWGKQNYGAVVRRQVDTDPQGALSALRGGKYDFVLHPQDVEEYANTAQHAVDRIAEKQLMETQRALAQEQRADMWAQRQLRESQAQNAATWFSKAMQGGPIDGHALADAVARQEITPEAATATLNAGNGHDDANTKFEMTKRAGDGTLTPDDLLNAMNNRTLSADTATSLLKGVNAKGSKEDNQVVRANYETLNTGLGGHAIDQGIDPFGTGKAESAMMLTQARGEWTRRVLVNGEDSSAVLADMMPRYSPKATMPTWLPQPQMGTVMAPDDVANVAAQTKAAFAAKQITQDQYNAQGQLLYRYAQFFDGLSQRQAAVQAATRAKAPQPPPAAAPPVSLVPLEGDTSFGGMK